MILINEWLPNPVGSDATGEWVELFNDGGSTSLTADDVPVNLNGWALQAGSKKINLSGTLSAGEYAVFKRTSTKLTLRNTDEKLFLYDARGKLADEAAFFGSAPEGKSFSRPRASFTEVATKAEKATAGRQVFAWSEPTPGAENKVSLDMGVVRNSYTAGAVLNPGVTQAGFLGLLFGTAVVLVGLLLYALKNHENLSKLFFGRDEAPWL